MLQEPTIRALRSASIVLMLLFAACPSDRAPRTTRKPTTASPSATTTPWPTLATTDLRVPASLSFVSPTVGFGLAFACDASRRCTLQLTRTTDAGATWQPHRDALRVTFPSEQPAAAIEFADERVGWIYGSLLLETRDGGTTWRRRAVAGVVTALQVRSRTVWLSTVQCEGVRLCRGSLYKQQVNDAEWNHHTATLECRRRGTARVTAVDADDAYVRVECEDPGRTALLHTGPERGRPADSLSFRAWYHTPCVEAGLAAYDRSRVWAACTDEPDTGGQGTRIHVSRTTGRTWMLLADTGSPATRRRGRGSLAYGGHFSTLVAVGPSTLLVARGKFGAVQRSTDGGRTWRTTLEDASGGLALRVLASDPRHVWAHGTAVLYKSGDAGATWRRLAASD